MKGKSAFFLTVATVVMVAQVGQAQYFQKTPNCTLAGIPVPVNVATGDLFGDGKPALVVSSWVRVPGSEEKYDPHKGRVLIFRQKKGMYALPADQEIAMLSPFGMAVGDFDGDGKADLALSPYGTFDLRLGKEQLRIPHLCPTPNGGAGQVIAAKLNKEGLRDFVSGPVWRKWLGNDQWEQGYFQGPKINDNKLSLVADLNDDGQRDLVFLSEGGKEIRLYYGPFVNMMVAARELSIFAQLSSPHPMAYLGVGDLNGDSRPDIIASTGFRPDPAERKTLIWLQNSPTGFTDNVPPSATIEGICGQIAIADVNKDDLDDLIVAEAGDSKLCIFLQTEGQPFAASVRDADETILAGNSPTFCVADLNGDGYPDIVHDDASKIGVYLNAGGKSITPNSRK